MSFFILGHREICEVCMRTDRKFCSRTLSKAALVYKIGTRNKKAYFLSC